MKASVQDGAFSWLLCLASFFNISVIGGFMYTTGMFYIMFQNSMGATDSEASLMTSINISVHVCVCPLVGLAIERFGNRLIAIVGAVLSTTGLVLSAFSTQVYQMYICYGIITGAGHGMLNLSSFIVIGPYFQKYRRVALGLVLAGFGVGSFAVPPVLNFLENVYGWRGAILLLAGINVHTLVTSSLFRPFEDQKESPQLQDAVTSKGKDESPGSTIVKAFNRKVLEILSFFKIVPYLCLMFCTLTLMFPVSMILTHFGSYLLSLHFTDEDVVTLYMVLGVSSTVARPIAGLIAELTHVNLAMYIVLTILLCGVLTLFLPLLNQLWMLCVYAALFQLLLGPYNSLVPAIIMEYIPTAQTPTAFGLYIFISVPGYIAGAPIGTWLYDYTQVYAHTFYLAGGLILLSGLTMAPAAYHIHKKTPHITTNQG